MVEGLKRLIELERLDAELATLEEEHRALPARRAALTAQLSAAEAGLATAHESLRAAELAQRQAERAAQDREAQAAKLEGQQFQVKTNEAYTTLLREIAHAREGLSGAETQILEAMEVIEAAAAAVAAGESAAKAARERADAGELAVETRDRELTARIAALREQRGSARGLVEPALVDLYERVATRRRPAVVTITSAFCTGCRVDIPPQRYIEIQRRQRVLTCERCQRILVPAG